MWVHPIDLSSQFLTRSSLTHGQSSFPDSLTSRVRVSNPSSKDWSKGGVQNVKFKFKTPKCLVWVYTQPKRIPKALCIYLSQNWIYTENWRNLKEAIRKKKSVLRLSGCWRQISSSTLINPCASAKEGWHGVRKMGPRRWDLWYKWNYTWSFKK